MDSVLAQLNSVPGVIGTMVCDAAGQVVANAFPPRFEAAMLARVARTIADGAPGLETVTGTIGMMDFRYDDARVVVKPVTGAHVVFLCAPAMNVQPLAICTAIAGPKIEKVLTATTRAVAAPAPAPAPAAPPGGQLLALVRRIDATIERKKLDAFKVRGAISIQAGFSLKFVDEDTADDVRKLAQLRAAATAVLGEPF